MSLAIENIVKRMNSPVLVLDQDEDIIQYFDQFTNAVRNTINPHSTKNLKKLTSKEFELIERVALFTHFIRNLDDDIRHLTSELGPKDRDEVKTLISQVVDLIELYKAEKKTLRSKNKALQIFFDKLAIEFYSLEETIEDLWRITDAELQNDINTLLKEF